MLEGLVAVGAVLFVVVCVPFGKGRGRDGTGGYGGTGGGGGGLRERTAKLVANTSTSDNEGVS